ncbi:MAG TPA: class I SAM-dependent methyltransferase [Streptosporangiaceae bacterium]
MSNDDNPVTGRRFLSRTAYADDRNLRARTAIFAYADASADPGWRLSPVPWDGTQVVADVGCGNGFDLRRLVPAGRCRHAIGLDLSPGMLASAGELRASGRLTLIQADAQRIPLGDGSVDVALAMHMLYHVPDLPAAVRELRRIVRPGGTALVSTNSAGSMSEVYDLFDAAISAQLGHPVSARPGPDFTLETGGPALESEFGSVRMLRNEMPLAIPAAQPVIAYLGSVREPVMALIGEPLDFDAALAEVAARVEQAIRVDGRFRTGHRSGVFVCGG